MGHIWLIGMMGSGKTTVGEKVAERLGMSFIDSDASVVEWSGRTIASLFDESEAVFRSIERDVISRIATGRDCVVATGGGAVLDPANVLTMRTSGTTILLEADVETLSRRLADTTDRPLLSGDTDISTIAHAREDVYRAAADAAIETTNKDVDNVVAEVVACIRT